MEKPVLTIADIDPVAVTALLDRYGLTLRHHPARAQLPGSFWGDAEAGLIGNTVHVRPDTPIHSLLHESCHYICMDAERRRNLHTDAGGDTDEENAVCYLQILLADDIPEMGRARMFEDMDAWGYSFRLGSAARWFEEDAEDALAWLLREKLVENGRPTYRLRGGDSHD